MHPDHLTRRGWLETTGAVFGAVAVTALPAASLLAADQAGEMSVLDIGAQKQLFVDDFLIHSTHGMHRTFHPPMKAADGRPVLQFDQPWEEPGTSILGTVIRDGERFRMWYRGGGSGPTGGVWCSAESADGLHWIKLKLGLVTHQGSRDNNIYVIGQPQAFTPFIDPNETQAARRF